MALRNTVLGYGSLSKFFHWVIVALIILQYFLAHTAHDLPRGLQQFKMYQYHKSVGITILALALLRLIWRWMGIVPTLPPGMKPYERFLAKFTHVALYVLLFAMPLSGWIMSN